MKQRASFVILLILMLLVQVSCVDEEDYADNPQGNFEALWHIMDEHYCFFDYKQQTLGVDWDEVHQRYACQICEDLTETQLFEILAGMLGELRDGHVNLYSSWDVGRNWSWREDYPPNYSDTLIDNYLGTDYRIATGLRYRILDDNVGYIRCPSFDNSMGSGNLDDILLYLSPCRGLIIDVRDNSGGLITSAQQLAARFTNEEMLVGYMQHKTGKGHNDFSSMQEQRIKPSRGIRWQKRVVVLTNRAVYSAANEFVKYMKCMPRAIVVGDSTGGGAGMPFSGELPNGWSVRFSACPMYDRNRQPVEDGIAPDHEVSLSYSDKLKNRDTLIEYARRLIAHGI